MLVVGTATSRRGLLEQWAAEISNGELHVNTADIAGDSVFGALPLAPWRLSRVLVLLDVSLASAIKVKDLAAAACLSESRFSQAFRCTLGEPPAAHLRRRRVELAQQLMLSTEKSLAEIACECGLADQSHLTKLFRQLVGITPAAWRRLRGAGSTGPVGSGSPQGARQ
jgi:transcriptional regulator GlxA family with amidase domain